jgi:hypothetical protein
MNRFFKRGLILAGYAAASFAAYVAFILLTQNAPPQGSGGMQDFGDALLFLGLFGVFALVPTALALYFMRSFQKFWTAFSIATLTFAVTGPVAAIMFPRLPESSWWVIVGVLDLLRVLGAPLLCLGFLIFAVIAPTRLSRRALPAAAVIEGAVGAYASFCLLILRHWL